MDYINTIVYSDLQQSYVAVPEEKRDLVIFEEGKEPRLPILKKPILDGDGEVEAEEDDDELPEGVQELDYDEDIAKRQLALLINQGDVPSDEGHNRFSIGKREWLVVTDDEADQLWDEDLDSYLDECVLGEMPEMAQNYFDREKWKNDARVDGRAHSLNRYDGNEEYETINGEDYYIYRQN